MVIISNNQPIIWEWFYTTHRNDDFGIVFWHGVYHMATLTNHHVAWNTLKPPRVAGCRPRRPPPLVPFMSTSPMRPQSCDPWGVSVNVSIFWGVCSTGGAQIRHIHIITIILMLIMIYLLILWYTMCIYIRIYIYMHIVTIVSQSQGFWDLVSWSRVRGSFRMQWRKTGPENMGASPRKSRHTST
jgi:apolipoprotein N-acyltransferase